MHEVGDMGIAIGVRIDATNQPGSRCSEKGRDTTVALAAVLRSLFILCVNIHLS